MDKVAAAAAAWTSCAPTKTSFQKDISLNALRSIKIETFTFLGETILFVLLIKFFKANWSCCLKQVYLLFAKHIKLQLITSQIFLPICSCENFRISSHRICNRFTKKKVSISQKKKTYRGSFTIFWQIHRETCKKVTLD